MSEGRVVYRRELDGKPAELQIIDASNATYQLIVDGIPQSQVCLDDPTIIEFDYARHIARVIDAHGAAAQPLTCLHLGGGALTLVRYVTATRPGSTQYVVDSEGELMIDLLGILPLADGSDVRFLFGDARDVSDGRPTGPRRGRHTADSSGRRVPWPDADVVVDLWNGAAVAARVASLEFYTRVASGMTGNGLMAVNVLDGPGFLFARRQAATLQALFAHVAVTMDHRMLDDPQMGNVLLFASNADLDTLDEPGWPEGDENPPAVLTDRGLAQWIDGARPMTDLNATDSPPLGGEYRARAESDE